MKKHKTLLIFGNHVGSMVGPFCQMTKHLSDPLYEYRFIGTGTPWKRTTCKRCLVLKNRRLTLRSWLNRKT